MTPVSRPTLQIHLAGRDKPDGEIPLAELTFFERHEFPAPAGAVADRDLRDGVIDDLSHDEIDDFIMALGQ